MIYLFYDILMNAAVLLLAPYFAIKMITAGKYRRGIPERFGFIRRAKTAALAGGEAVWVHAVSVGETKAALPLVKALKQRRPGIKVAFSTVTATGNDVAAREGAGLIDCLFFFPLDLSWAASRTIKAVRPSLFVTVEKEYWPNLFRLLSSSGTPIAVVNGALSERSHRRFMRLGRFSGDLFGRVSAFCARTEEDRRRAVEAGVPASKTLTTGNMKFDMPRADERGAAALAFALGIAPGRPVIVAGSTHEGEEAVILNVFARLRTSHQGLKLVVAPRHPERFSSVASLMQKSGLAFARRSAPGDKSGAELLLLDTVGELAAVYSLSTAAFVGGSLVDGVGGHNLLEPALYSRPVVYGDRLTVYDAMGRMLEAAGGGMRAEGENALHDAFKALLDDEVLRKKTGEAARSAVEANMGAVSRTVDALERLMTR